MKKTTRQLREQKLRLKALREDILVEYKSMIQMLVRSHGGLDADDVRLECLSVIAQHVTTRSKDRLHRKVRARTETVYVDKLPELEELDW
jgi:hypothetical protein